MDTVLAIDPAEEAYLLSVLNMEEADLHGALIAAIHEKYLSSHSRKGNRPKKGCGKGGAKTQKTEGQKVSRRPTVPNLGGNQ